MNNYPLGNYNQQSQMKSYQLHQSFAKFPPQSSIMSVEQENQQQQINQINLAQSNLFIQENPQYYENNENIKPQSPITQFYHRRVNSHQIQKSPQQQSCFKSQCPSPIRYYPREQQQIPLCQCEIEQLWQEFLETKLRQLKRPCCHHHQRGYYMPY